MDRASPPNPFLSGSFRFQFNYVMHMFQDFVRFVGGGLKFSIFSFSGGGGDMRSVPVWKSKDNLWGSILFHHMRRGRLSLLALSLLQLLVICWEEN